MNAKTIGMLGGGQLALMAAQAAQSIGLDVMPFDPNPDSPAFKICRRYLTTHWNHPNALRFLSYQADVITYEFENIPLETLNILQKEHGKTIYPNPNLLEITQHRLSEKNYLNKIGIPTTDYAVFENQEQLGDVLENWNEEQCILKTCRFGYDGKGQVFYKKNDMLPGLKGELIIERCVDFDCEISVIVARDQFSTIKCYPAVMNEHKNHILHKTTAPAPIKKEIANTARDYAEKLAKETELVGVLALELFVTKTGEVLANEIAPRPHNSGHWTIEGCKTSQFEQQIRAVAGLPLGDIDPVRPAEMINLLGNDIDNLSAYESNPNAHIHLYGKPETKPGRKMGHVTILKEA